jgi:putative transposase
MPMSTQPVAGRVRKTYDFIMSHRAGHSVQMMCGLLGVAPSGYYDWLKQPMSSFYNRSRRLGHLGGVSPEQFEAAHKPRRQGVH